MKKLLPNSNPTELSAEFAHQIQSEHPGASVLVYPDAGMVGYLMPEKNYYEYNTAYFDGNKQFIYSKRFYNAEFDGTDGARKAAIDFADKNNKKYMELVNKETHKYKID